MKVLNNIAVVSWVMVLSFTAAAQNVIEDQGVGLSRVELESLVSFWSPEMKAAAAKSDGDRLELLNMALANKKMATDAETILPGLDPKAYWKHVFTIRNMNRQFLVNQHLSTLEVPDMTALSEERYEAAKDQYARVPERRSSSHILLLCPPGSCDRAERRPEAENILAQLKGGENFEELAVKYSEDPGSKNKGGKFDKWMQLGEKGVAPHYTGGVFSIEKIGGYSEVVETQFGFHIIRLDGLEESYYKSYDEVKEQLIEALEGEFVNLSAKEFDAQYRITDEAVIDGKAMEEIFAPFK